MSAPGLSFKFKLMHKLVAAFLATFLIIILFILVATKLLVTDNFHTYLNELQWQRADRVVEAIVEVIEENNNDITVFSRDPGQWHMLMMSLFSSEPGQQGSGPPPGADFLPPGPASGPPPIGAPETGSGPPGAQGPAQGPPPVVSMDSMEISLVRDSLSLYGLQENRLGGPPIDLQDSLRKEIHAGGKVVGYLVMRNLVDIKDKRAIIFQKSFNRILILTGGMGILVAFLVSIFVARHLLAPVKSLTRGTRALAEKRLETRIDVTSNDELGLLAENFNWMADQIQLMTQELTDLSLKDPLTSLRNRRYFDQFIAPEARSLIKERLYKNKIGDERRTDDLKGLGLLIIDIDHFKQVNDGFGHDVGDRVLKQFSEVISSRLRETDAAIRLGGEEFLIALKNTRFDFLATYAEKIRSRIAEHPFEIDDQGHTIQLTCSIGFSRFPFSEKTPDFIDISEVLSIADLTLYYAKLNGRNMCVGVRPVGEAIPECDKSMLLTDIDYGIRQNVWSLELSSSS